MMENMGVVVRLSLMLSRYLVVYVDVLFGYRAFRIVGHCFPACLCGEFGVVLLRQYPVNAVGEVLRRFVLRHVSVVQVDRKSTRLNSSHANISYAVFCLKKKK